VSELAAQRNPASLGWLVGFWLLVLLAIFLAAAVVPRPAYAGFTDTTAVLAVIGGTAVAIERTIEGFWILLAQISGGSSPLREAAARVSGLRDDLDGAAKPLLAQAGQAIADASTANNWTRDQLAAANRELGSVRARVEQAKVQLAGDPRLSATVDAALLDIGYLQQSYPALDELGSRLSLSLTTAAGIVAALKDNPGRRLITLLAGPCLGLVVAASFGLDLFQGASTLVWPYWGVAATGVVMGLGANPAHEVIRAVQEYKHRLKA
jgi:hypothetical protein